MTTTLKNTFEAGCLSEGFKGLEKLSGHSRRITAFACKNPCCNFYKKKVTIAENSSRAYCSFCHSALKKLR